LGIFACEYDYGIGEGGREGEEGGRGSAYYQEVLYWGMHHAKLTVEIPQSYLKHIVRPCKRVKERERNNRVDRRE
jgi:hypothetical protein